MSILATGDEYTDTRVKTQKAAKITNEKKLGGGKKKVFTPNLTDIFHMG